NPSTPQPPPSPSAIPPRERRATVAHQELRLDQRFEYGPADHGMAGPEAHRLLVSQRHSRHLDEIRLDTSLQFLEVEVLVDQRGGRRHLPSLVIAYSRPD